MVTRDAEDGFLRALKSFPAVLLAGTRSSGKGMLCRETFPERPCVNLAETETRAQAEGAPGMFLSRYPDGGILLRVHLTRSLWARLCEDIQRNAVPGRWILTALHELDDRPAESMALVHVLPLSYNEAVRFGTHPTVLDDALFTGSCPRIHAKHYPPERWLDSYLAGYLDRDVARILNVRDRAVFHRFMKACAGWTARPVNLAAMAAECGVSQPTAKAWLAALEATFMTFLLPGFAGSGTVRPARKPVLHFFDTGLVCRLLDIRSAAELAVHPMREAVFDTWVASEILKSRIHRGMHGGVFHCRGGRDDRAALVIERGEGHCLVEACADAEPPGEVTQRLDGLRKALGPGDAFIVCGGESREGNIVPWMRLHDEQIAGGSSACL
jgi:hypothetical protein